MMTVSEFISIFVINVVHLEVDGVGCERLLGLRHVGLTARLQQCVSPELPEEPVLWGEKQSNVLDSDLTSFLRRSFVTFSSCVCETSMADLAWQLRARGSAPWLRRREHTSLRPLEAASCSGVNCDIN